MRAEHMRELFRVIGNSGTAPQAPPMSKATRIHFVESAFECAVRELHSDRPGNAIVIIEDVMRAIEKTWTRE